MLIHQLNHCPHCGIIDDRVVILLDSESRQNFMLHKDISSDFVTTMHCGICLDGDGLVQVINHTLIIGYKYPIAFTEIPRSKEDVLCL